MRTTFTVTQIADFLDVTGGDVLQVAEDLGIPGDEYALLEMDEIVGALVDACM